MQTAFATARDDRQSCLEELGAKIASHVPETQIEEIDLATGTCVSLRFEPLDPVITAWCGAGPDRWIFIHRDSSTGALLGSRPRAQ